MKKAMKFNLLTLSAICILFISSNSCTIIGYTVGASFDRGNEESDTLNVMEINKINQGKTIELKCNDQKAYSGVYQGNKQISQDKYTDLYLQFKNNYPDDLSIPDIGDTIEIHNLKTGRLEKGRFIAFETDSVIMKSLDSDQVYHSKIELTDQVIFHRQKPFQASNYKDLPMITTIIIRNEAGNDLEFPVNDVDYILVNKEHYARILGLFIGMAVDVAMIVLFFIPNMPQY